MKLGDLEAFVDIVESGGLTAAAHRRGVTQPALSRLLRELETRLRAQLLRRTGRGIELTPAGAIFQKYCVETLQRYDEVRLQISDQVKALPRRLHISVPLRVGWLLIPDLYRNFGETLPETRVHIIEEPSNRARELLNDGKLDAALTYSPSTAADRDFVPLFVEDLFALGSPALLRADGGTITLQELAALPLLLPSVGPYRTLIQSAFRSAGFDPQTARELETAEGLLAFAAECEGIAILPMSNIRQEVTRNEIVASLIVEPGISRRIGVQLSPTMSKHAAGPVLSVIRSVMARSAKLAAWRRLSSQGRTK